MTSVPIYEAKNKLPFFIRLVENGETLEITRHGVPVAYLVNKDEKLTTSETDKFKIVMDKWRKKYSDCFLSEEEKKYF